MPPTSRPEAVAVFRDRITDEICRAFGLSPAGAPRRLLGPLFRYPAGRFARIIAHADDEIRSSGLNGGARSILADLTLEPAIRGAKSIPRDGPLLIASNHPGAYDSLAIMSAVPRKDLKVVISDVGFTRAFAAAREYYIYAPRDTAGRMKALRASIAHLAGGGALLLYPHVDVEPDPESGHGAREALRDWSRSLDIILRRVPEASLVVAIASGILMPRFLDNPIVKIRKAAAQRQKLAEFLQVSWQMVFPRSVRPGIHVSFSEPVEGRDLPRDALFPAVVAMAERLLEDHLEALRATPGRSGPMDDATG
ncbi:MAG: hypothetical protein A2V76_01450 [Candidatus Aminicenantes bacterium RBG_16_63_14]|nr:MAG: hypothetical protein A2V76_01450 [Candidatus Aminicenantes bacterium RBG_16_63_14]OGD27758.1 MAG: hypothetical protein A2V57_05685 [Candidatus Aminicenantes bacterium RBG_19FT_COMBO_65_30]